MYAGLDAKGWDPFASECQVSCLRVWGLSNTIRKPGSIQIATKLQRVCTNQNTGYDVSLDFLSVWFERMNRHLPCFS